MCYWGLCVMFHFQYRIDSKLSIPACVYVCVCVCVCVGGGGGGGGRIVVLLLRGMIQGREREFVESGVP